MRPGLWTRLPSRCPATRQVLSFDEGQVSSRVPAACRLLRPCHPEVTARCSAVKRHERGWASARATRQEFPQSPALTPLPWSWAQSLASAWPRVCQPLTQAASRLRVCSPIEASSVPLRGREAKLKQAPVCFLSLLAAPHSSCAHAHTESLQSREHGDGGGPSQAWFCSAQATGRGDRSCCNGPPSGTKAESTALTTQLVVTQDWCPLRSASPELPLASLSVSCWLQRGR